MSKPGPLEDELQNAVEEAIEQYKAAGGIPAGVIAVCAYLLEQMIEVQPEKIRDRATNMVHQRICEMKNADDRQRP
jgi:hypothetical protein